MSDNLKTIEQDVVDFIDPNGPPQSILAQNHQKILKDVLLKTGKYTGFSFFAKNSITSFSPGSFSWESNPMNNTSFFDIKISKLTSDLNNIGVILDTLNKGDYIKFKDYNGRSGMFIYNSHSESLDADNNQVCIINIKAVEGNVNYIYQLQETNVCVIDFFKKDKIESGLNFHFGQVKIIDGILPDFSNFSSVLDSQSSTLISPFYICEVDGFFYFIYDQSNELFTIDSFASNKIIIQGKNNLIIEESLSFEYFEKSTTRYKVFSLEFGSIISNINIDVGEIYYFDYFQTSSGNQFSNKVIEVADISSFTLQSKYNGSIYRMKQVSQNVSVSLFDSSFLSNEVLQKDNTSIVQYFHAVCLQQRTFNFTHTNNLIFNNDDGILTNTLSFSVEGSGFFRIECVRDDSQYTFHISKLGFKESSASSGLSVINGTFIPQLYTSSGNVYGDSSSNGVYSKIGSQVIVSVSMNSITNPASTSGFLRIRDLPFEPNTVYGGNIMRSSGSSVSFLGVTPVVNAGSTDIIFIRDDSSPAVENVSWSGSGAGASLYCSVVYNTND